MGSKHIIGN